jgi:hypothetical protein
MVIDGLHRKVCFRRLRLRSVPDQSARSSSTAAFLVDDHRSASTASFLVHRAAKPQAAET